MESKFSESDSSFYDQEYFLGMEFRYLSGAHGNKIRTVKQFLGNLQDQHILDLGCGGGIFSHILSGAGAKIEGIDYSKAAVDFAKSRYPVLTFRQGSAYDLKTYSDASFDVVVMMDIIEHLSDQNKALREVHRLLKTEGRLIISTDLDESYWHVGFFNRIFWFSMRFSKEGRAYRLIKETEAKIAAKKYYNASHIGLLSYSKLDEIARQNGFRIIRHEVFPLSRVWWRDTLCKWLPYRARGDHQMLLAEKN